MTAKLVAEEGVLKGLVLSLEDGDQWVIGRDPDACQLLIEDPSASRKHLICRTTPQGILAENLSTTNPVQINDEEIHEPRLLNNGDVVKIGSGLFRFYNEAAAQLVKENPEENFVQPKTDEEISEPNDDDLSVLPEDAEEAQKSDIENNEISSLEEASLPEISTSENPPSEPFSNEAPPFETEEPPIVDEQAENPEDVLPEPNEKEIAPLSYRAHQDPHTDSDHFEDDLSERHDSIYEEEPSDKNLLAEINFGLSETGRWLLKVIGGPNNGAEFSMHANSSYLLGTDPNSCDIVFHDNSVSRQHAKITIDEEDRLSIEDLKSRNGTLVDGEPLTGKRDFSANILVTLGTTSFIIFDREGEMQTIISPLLPSIVKMLKKEEPAPEEVAPPTNNEAPPEEPIAPLLPLHPEKPHHNTLSAIILLGILAGLFAVIGIGTSTLFKSEPFVVTETVDPVASLDNTLANFPNVKYSFNKNTGRLLLVGHVVSASEKSQLLYSLQSFKFIKNLDDSGIIIDEFVWREINQILEKSPAWKGISVSSPNAGRFLLSGYLHTRMQAENLNDYMNANFPYIDLLDNRIVVEEDVKNSINNLFLSKGIKTNIKAELNNGEVTLTGGVPAGKEGDVDSLLEEVKKIYGVRNVRNYLTEIAPEQSMVNISDRYQVSGYSNQGGNLNVIINGRILRSGDVLDGMSITSVRPQAVYLEKDGTKYRIDF